MEQEPPRTWLMDENGFYFISDGGFYEWLRLALDGTLCTTHRNQTSLGMAHIQAEHDKNSK